MKSLHRFILGALSSLFLAIGLVRAAEKVDPVTKHFSAGSTQVSGIAPDCVTECNADLDNR